MRSSQSHCAHDRVLPQTLMYQLSRLKMLHALLAIKKLSLHSFLSCTLCNVAMHAHPA